MSKKVITILVVTFLIITILVCVIVQTNIVLKNNITVIARSIGERTQEQSIDELKRIFGSKNVFLIKNVYPLASASKKTFELAFKNKKKWILVVDCDTFFFEDKIFLFIKKADKLIKKDKNAFCFQGLVFDKFSNSKRMSGFYLYYFKNLKYKNEYYNFCKNKIRPEACIRDHIEKEGYNSYQSNDIVGIHDFFQNERDIVKKIILHSKKNEIETLEWKNNWPELSKKDDDFKYALLALEISKTIKDNLIPDSKEFDKYLSKYNILNNKKELTFKEIKEVINKYNTQSKKEVINEPFIKKLKPINPAY